jgi:uncharacterized protein (TIGR03663 family)
MHSRFIGRAAYGAAAVLALSPAMVFYGRYAIHETLLILSQVVFSYGFLKWRLEGGRSSVYAMVAGVCIAIATKETFFIFVGTWLIAWACVRIAARLFPVADDRGSRWLHEAQPVGGKRTWSIAVGVGVIAVLAVYSGFFYFREGITAMFKAYAFWTKTGTGSTGHEKPFIYWLEILGRYEWPFLLTLLIAPLASLRGSHQMRFFTLVGFGSWLAYSLIPYKTPWCIVGILWPLAFVLGFLMTETIGERTRSLFARIGYRSVVLIAVAVSTYTMLRLNFRDYEKKGEPYVYVQSTKDVNEVTRLIADRVRSHPEDRNMFIQVLVRDPWPFPWILSEYTKVQYGNVSPVTSIDGAVIFVDGSQSADIERRLPRRYFRRSLTVRDSYEAGYAYFDFDRFRQQFPEGTQVVGGQPAPQDLMLESPGLRGPASDTNSARPTEGKR